jgi:hypothetical protein
MCLAEPVTLAVEVPIDFGMIRQKKKPNESSFQQVSMLIGKTGGIERACTVNEPRCI